MEAAKPAAWDTGTEPWYCWACSNTGQGVEIDEFGTTDEMGCECCGEFGKSHEFDAEIPPCYPKKVRDKWYATHEKFEDEDSGYVQWYAKEEPACPDCNGKGYTQAERTRRRRSWKKGYVVETRLETITCHRCGATGRLLVAPSKGVAT